MLIYQHSLRCGVMPSVLDKEPADLYIDVMSAQKNEIKFIDEI